MSRYRLIAKLRSQQWFADLTAWLDGQGIRWEVARDNRCGHPSLRLTLQDGRQIKQVIPCTPRQGQAPSQQIMRMRRTIRAAQIGIEPDDQQPDGAASGWTPERIACLTRGVDPLAASRRGSSQD